MDPRLDPEQDVVERDLGSEREVANPLPEGTVVDLDALERCIHDPACIARTHDDDRCRPDTACWVMLDDTPHHVSHAGRCWHELTGDGDIQTLIVEPDEPGVVVASADAEPAHDDAAEDVTASSAAPVVEQPVIYDAGTSDQGLMIALRDGLYTKLVDEGNPPQLSITLATLYAEWKLANIPQTMAMLASLAESIGGVLNTDGEGGGFLAKMIGKAMRGNAG